MYERFTDRARKVMQLANQEAQRFNHEYIGTEHILLGLIKEGSGVASNVLKNLDIDLAKIRRQIEKIVQCGPDTVTIGKLPQTPRAKKVVEYSIEEARDLNHNYVGTEHLLLGLIREEEGLASQVLMNLGLNLKQVREEVLNLLGQSREIGDPAVEKNRAPTPTLDTFGRDLGQLASDGGLSPIVGRAREMERVLLVLGCRTHRHPLLVGAVGVGKRSIVRGLAMRTALASDCPEVLRERRLVALSLSKMITVTGDSRSFEEQLRTISLEVLKAKNIILFLDDVANLLEPASGLPGSYVCNALKSALGSDAIQCISVATPEQYHAHIATDPILGRHFQPIVVEPPSKSEVLEMLRQVRPLYEAHHRAQVRDVALAAAVEFAASNGDRCIPGRAILLLDQAGALVRMRNAPRPPDWTFLNTQIDQLTQQKEVAVAEQDFATAAGLRDQVDQLRKRKEEIARCWTEQTKEVAGVLDRETIVEVQRLMNG